MISEKNLKRYEGKAIKEIIYKCDNHITFVFDDGKTIDIWAESATQYNIPVLDVKIIWKKDVETV